MCRRRCPWNERKDRVQCKNRYCRAASGRAGLAVLASGDYMASIQTFLRQEIRLRAAREPTVVPFIPTELAVHGGSQNVTSEIAIRCISYRVESFRSAKGTPAIQLDQRIEPNYIHIIRAANEHARTPRSPCVCACCVLAPTHAPPNLPILFLLGRLNVPDLPLCLSATAPLRRPSAPKAITEGRSSGGRHP